MTTIVHFANEFMFTDDLAEVVEDTLTNTWAPYGVDYRWLNAMAIEIVVPDEIDYSEVLQDLAEDMCQYLDSLGTLWVPKFLLNKFSLANPLTFLGNRSKLVLSLGTAIPPRMTD